MKTKFIHIRGAKQATIAVECDDSDNVLAYAVARCHPKDNFCKATGRIKAEGRLHSKQDRCELKNEKVAIKMPFKEFVPIIHEQYGEAK